MDYLDDNGEFIDNPQDPGSRISHTSPANLPQIGDDGKVIPPVPVNPSDYDITPAHTEVKLDFSVPGGFDFHNTGPRLSIKNKPTIATKKPSPPALQDAYNLHLQGGQTRVKLTGPIGENQGPLDFRTPSGFTEYSDLSDAPRLVPDSVKALPGESREDTLARSVQLREAQKAQARATRAQQLATHAELNIPNQPAVIPTAFAEGLGEGIRTAGVGLAALTRQDPEDNPALQQPILTSTALTPEERDQLGAKIASGAGQLAGFGLTSAVAGPIGVGLVGAAQGAGATYEDAIRNGASHEDALNAAIPGAVIGLIQGIPFARGPQGVLRGTTEVVAQQLSAQLLNNINAKVVSGYDPQRAITEGFKETAILATVLGGATHAVLGGIGVPTKEEGKFRALNPTEYLTTGDHLEGVVPTGDPNLSQESIPGYREVLRAYKDSEDFKSLPSDKQALVNDELSRLEPVRDIPQIQTVSEAKEKLYQSEQTQQDLPSPKGRDFAGELGGFEGGFEGGQVVNIQDLPSESFLASFNNPLRPRIITKFPASAKESPVLILNNLASKLLTDIRGKAYPGLVEMGSDNPHVIESKYIPKLAAQAIEESLTYPATSPERLEFQAIGDILHASSALGTDVTFIPTKGRLSPEMYKTIRRHEGVHSEQFKVAGELRRTGENPEARIYSLTDQGFLAEHPLADKILASEALSQYPPQTWTAEAAAYAMSGDGDRLGLSKSEAAQFAADYKLHLAAKYGDVVDGLFERVSPEVKKVIDDKAVKRARMFPCAG